MAGEFLVRLGTTSAIALSGTGTEGTTMITVPVSSTYKTTSTTLVDSSRNSKGEVVSNVIRAGIRKIEMSWKVIGASDYSKMAKFFNNNFMFYAYYFDTDTNGWTTKHFYVGDRVVNAVQNKQLAFTNVGGRLAPEYYENFKISLIEV